MPIQASFCAAYLTELGEWREDDWGAHKFVHALKGDQLNGYAHPRIGGNARRISNSNRDISMYWFAEWAADRIAAAYPDIPLSLFPVPNSSITVDSGDDYRTAVIADRLASALERRDIYTPVSRALRWRQPMTPSRRGGSRNPHELKRNLILHGETFNPAGILVDDVMTTGGHLQACASVLRDNGVAVDQAYCGGRSTWEQLPDPFLVPGEQIPEI